MLQQKDYLLRQVQQLAEMVEAMVGLQKPAEDAEVEQRLDDAYGRLLNMDRQLFETLDVASLARMLGDSHRIVLLARVMQAEGDWLRARGEEPLALRRYKRAYGLLQECLDEPDCLEVLASLEARLEG